MNFDFFDDVISSNTANDSFISLGIFASITGTSLSFYSCATLPCDLVSDFSQLVKSVTLTPNVIEAIEIKMQYDTTNSQANVYINGDASPVKIIFPFILFL